ncbi:MAG: Cytochrome [Pseudomonadota bacterium]|jgi:hypothetical protein
MTGRKHARCQEFSNVGALGGPMFGGSALGAFHGGLPGVCFGLLAAACAEELPADVANYRTECVLMNGSPIPQAGRDDPHNGVKNVYACHLSLAEVQANRRPLPEGTVIVKESTRSDADFAWLIATARKSNGQWTWNEYSRNFSDEPFVHILAGEQVCIDCHQKVESADWIYTSYGR